MPKKPHRKNKTKPAVVVSTSEPTTTAEGDEKVLEDDIPQVFGECKFEKKKNGTNLGGLINGQFYPTVSLCTPTFNRRPFIPIMLELFRNQLYPRHRMEWIILDDGTDPIGDLLDAATDIREHIKYIRLAKKIPLGKKRNMMHSFCNGQFIVYIDDDDYYPPERVSHAIEMLMRHPDKLIAGSSMMFMYFQHNKQMVQCGPYGPNHATAATFAFRRELLDQTRFDDVAYLAEETSFLKRHTIPILQLDAMKTILVFSHGHNTFDKRVLLEEKNKAIKESNYTVRDFIKTSKENSIYQFFVHEVFTLLDSYDPGHPRNKPDVLLYMEKLKKERSQPSVLNDLMVPMLPIVMSTENGQPPRALTQEEVVDILKQLTAQIKSLQDENGQLKSQIMQHQILQHTPSKTEPEQMPHQPQTLPTQELPLKSPDSNAHVEFTGSISGLAFPGVLDDNSNK